MATDTTAEGKVPAQIAAAPEGIHRATLVQNFLRQVSERAAKPALFFRTGDRHDVRPSAWNLAEDHDETHDRADHVEGHLHDVGGIDTGGQARVHAEGDHRPQPGPVTRHQQAPCPVVTPARAVEQVVGIVIRARCRHDSPPRRNAPNC